jgi:hypothetical protein
MHVLFAFLLFFAAVMADLSPRQLDAVAADNCSITPTACYLSISYPLALRPGLDCTVSPLSVLTQYNFQCLSSNCSSTQKCGTAPLGGNCLAITDCVTQNCTEAVCTYRIVPVGGGCLLDQECLGYPANLCDVLSGQCRVKSGGSCNGIPQWMTWVI